MFCAIAFQFLFILHFSKLIIEKILIFSVFRPLYYLGQKIFTRFNVGGYLSVPDVVLRNWLQVSTLTKKAFLIQIVFFYYYFHS